MKNMRLALLILVLSSGVAAATNALRTKGKVPWVPAPEKAKAPAVVVPKPPPTAGSDTALEKGTTDKTVPPPHVEPPPAPAAEDGAQFVTLDEVVAHFTAGDAKFIDARNADEYAAGHIKGAMNVPSSAAYESMEQVQQFFGSGENIIVYCGGGHCDASHNVAKVLGEFGYDHVKIYKNGWEELALSPRMAELTEKGGGTP